MQPKRKQIKLIHRCYKRYILIIVKSDNLYDDKLNLDFISISRNTSKENKYKEVLGQRCEQLWSHRREASDPDPLW